jgi:hypothetical protein
MVEPEQSVLGIVLAAGGGDNLDPDGQTDSAPLSWQQFVAKKKEFC